MKGTARMGQWRAYRVGRRDSPVTGRPTRREPRGDAHSPQGRPCRVARRAPVRGLEVRDQHLVAAPPGRAQHVARASDLHLRAAGHASRAAAPELDVDARSVRASVGTRAELPAKRAGPRAAVVDLQEIAGPHLVISQECAPGLSAARTCGSRASHVALDRALRDADAELQELASNPFGSPNPVLGRRAVDEAMTSGARRGSRGRVERDLRRQNRRKPSRCHRSTVSGLTSSKACRPRWRLASSTIRPRSWTRKDGRLTAREATMSCCRRSALSASCSARERVRSAMKPLATPDGRHALRSALSDRAAEEGSSHDTCPARVASLVLIAFISLFSARTRPLRCWPERPRPSRSTRSPWS